MKLAHITYGEIGSWFASWYLRLAFVFSFLFVPWVCCFPFVLCLACFFLIGRSTSILKFFALEFLSVLALLHSFFLQQNIIAIGLCFGPWFFLHCLRVCAVCAVFRTISSQLWNLLDAILRV